MKRYFQISVYIAVVITLFGTNTFAQDNKIGSKDCSTATQLCNNDVVEDQLQSGTNKIGVNDIPVSFSSCFAPKTERNPFWYQFSPENTGTFEMYLNASLDKDFDFIIFDVTNGCENKQVLQCNNSQLDLDFDEIGTGISSDSANKYEPNFPGIQNSWEPTLNVIAGKTYAIYVENRLLKKSDTFTVSFGGTSRFRNIAAAFATNAPYCFGKPVVFTNQTVGVGTITYVWQFGDGATSTLKDPVHTYTTPGSYWAKLTAGNGNCSYSDSLLIDIPITIIASAGADAPVCNGKSVNLNATGGTTYVWSPATGLSNSTIANPVANPTTTTNYMVTVTDAQGCKGTDEIVITVNENPIVDAGTDKELCSGDSLTLNATGASTYVWDATPALSDLNIANPIAKPTLNTTFVVTGTDLQGCTAQDIVTITLKELPTASAGTDVNICNGKNTTLAATGGVNYLWSPATGLSNPNIAQPIASPTATTTYSVTVAGPNGCKKTDDVTVTVDPLPTVSAGADINICEGTSTNLIATGGDIYVWSPSQGLSNASIANPSATPTNTTIYTVTVTDNKGCINTDDVEVSITLAPNVSAGADKTLCKGDSVVLVGSGTTNYTWSPALGLSSVTVATPFAFPTITTTYIVTGDNGGCAKSDTVIVTVNDKPIANAGNDAAVCNGKATTLNGSGGVSYVWTPALGLSNINISNPVANPAATTTYTVEVMAGNGCKSKDDVVISVNSNPIANAGNDLAICKGTPKQLAASGGANYVWSPANGLSNININNPLANPINTTTYTVIVTDALGCQATDQIIVTVDALPTVDAGIDRTVCLLDTVQLIATGGISYSWNNATTLSSATIANPKAIPTTTTTYVVTASDGKCDAKDSVQINVNALPNANAGNDVSACNGKPAQLAATGGVTYSWSPSTGLTNAAIANPVASPTIQTNYTVTVTGINGCKAKDQVLVNILTNPTASAGSDLAICKGTPKQLAASGGTNYVWSPANGLSNININNPSANPINTTTYTVIVTDALGCQATDQIIVTVDDLPTVDAGINRIICLKDTVQLIATGGISYSWNNATTLSSASIANPKAIPTATTTYVVTASDGTCDAKDSVRITVNALPNANAGNDVSACNGKPAQLAATGGVSYSWSPSTALTNVNIANPVASPIIQTNYTVTVTGINGCKAKDQVLVNILTNPTASAGSDLAICRGTPTALGASGGVTYSWSPSIGLSNTNVANPNASPLINTTYTVTVTNAGGCQDKDDIIITVDNLPAIDAGTDKTICAGDTTQLIASGGTTYTWTPAISLINPSTASPKALPSTTTMYVVSGSDGKCANKDSVKVNVNALPTASAGTDLSACNGKPAQLAATGGVSYSWSPVTGLSNANIANPIANPNISTTYTVTVTGINNCKKTDNVVVNLTANPDVKIIASSSKVCAGTISNLTASGGANYAWTPSLGLSSTTIANPDAKPLVNTVYRVLGTDASGCQGTDSILITVDALPIITASNDDSTCIGVGVPISAAGATSYTWSPSLGLSADNITNPTASPSITTTYIVTGKDANGCINTADVAITITNGTPVNAGADVSFCFGKNTTLNAIGTGNTFVWSPATGLSNANIQNPTATPTENTTYTVAMTDAKGCTNIDSVKVDVNYIAINVTKDTVLCTSSQLQLSASGGTVYSWTPATGLSNAAIANPIATLTNDIDYRVDITDANGCKNFDSVKVALSSLPVVTVSNDTTICNGRNAVLKATGGVNYTWSPATGLSDATIANPIATPTANTKYTVTAFGNNGCSKSDTVEVKVTFIAITTSNDTTLCFGKGSNLNATGGVTYSWSPATGLSNANIANPIAAPSVTTDYIVTVTDAQGCKNDGDVKVNINYIAATVSNDTTLCKGTAVNLTATGGNTFVWSPSKGLSANNIPNPIATPDSNITYIVISKDAFGCQSLDSVKITVNNLPTLTTSNDTAVCNGNSANLLVNGATNYSWSPATSLDNANIASPKANPSVTTTFAVVGTDINGCQKTDSVKVTVNYINILVSADTTMCLGESASLKAFGGVDFAWTPSNGLSSNTISNPIATPDTTTLYVVTVKDAQGCINQDTIAVNVRKLPTVTAGADINVCLSKSVNLAASGASSFIWSPAISLSNPNIANPIASPLVTTKYIVQGFDNFGCQNIDSVTVSISESSLIDAGRDTSVCNGNAIALNAVGGIEYSWSPTAGLDNAAIANPIATPTSTTNYVVTVKDGIGCLYTDTVIVNVNNITVSVSSDTTVCSGGQVQLNASGGLNYSWFPNLALSDSSLANPIATPISNITYTVTVTDNIGCLGKDSVQVTVNQLPNINAGIDVSVCLGKSTTLNAQGGMSYSWTPTATLTNANIANPEAITGITTTYFVEGTDANGCSSIDSVIVNITNNVAGNAIAMPDTFCSGSPVLLTALPDASVSLAANPYSFDGGNTFLINNNFQIPSVIDDSTAKVMIKDITGCLSDTLDVNMIRKIFLATVSELSGVTCKGLNDGIAQISDISGGESPYAFYQNNNAPTADSIFRNLNAGLQTLFVIDNQACISKYSIDISINSSIISTAKLTDAKCFGGADGVAEIEATGGAGSYLFAINGSGFNTNNTFNALPVGNHIVLIQDSLMCIDSLQIAILSPDELNILVPNTPSNVTCYGKSDGAIILSGLGGVKEYKYALGNTQFNADSNYTNLSAGLFQAYIMDKNGCKDSINFSITSPDSLVANYSVLQQPKCGGIEGIIAFDSIKGGTPAYKKIVNGNAPITADTIGKFLPGNHIVKIVDKNGCENIVDIVFEIDSNAVRGRLILDSTTCFLTPDGRITLTDLAGGIRPYQFSLSDSLSYGSDTIFANLIAGAYPIFAKNANGCISQLTANIEEPTEISAAVSNLKSISCFGLTDGSATISGLGGRGGYQYSIDNINFSANNILQNLSRADDTVYVKDVKSCVGLQAINIIEPDSIFAQIDQVSPASCNGGDGVAQVILTSGGVGALAYSLDNGANFQSDKNFTKLDAGIYAVIIKDENSCQRNAVFTIGASPNALDVAAIKKEIIDIGCRTDVKGMIKLSNFVGAPAPYLFAIDSLSSFTLDSTLANLDAGVYLIRIKDGNQCNYKISASISKSDSITFEPQVVQQETCINSDGQIEINNVAGGSGKYSFRMNASDFQASNIFLNLPQGSKSITVTDSILPSCASTMFITLTQKPGPIALTRTTEPTCFGLENGSITIDTVVGGVAPYSFSLDNDNFFTEQIFDGLTADTFRLYIKDAACSVAYRNRDSVSVDTNIFLAQSTYVLSQPDSVTAEAFFLDGFTSDASSVSGIYNIKGGTAPYRWSFNDDVGTFKKITSDTLIFEGLQQGNYTVYLLDTNSCKQNLTINIGRTFKIPNLFTPNNSDGNQYFEIPGLKTNSTLTIVNRWGGQVYYSGDYDNTWDGEGCDDGIYYYELKIPQVATYKGWVQIARGK